MKYTIATRGSQLALWQAEHVKSELLKLDPSLEIELNIIKTQGDIILDTSLAKIGGKGLFVKEIETALLEKTADIAVHSMKDMPTELPEGLVLASILEREDPTDAFVSNTYNDFSELPEGAVVGTSSLRRSSQLLSESKYEIKLLRGNVNTRLRKLDEGQFDAIILASAGLKRLEFSNRIKNSFPVDKMIPSAGQGAVGVECRGDDTKLLELLSKLNNNGSAAAVKAEREFNTVVGGSCQIPAGCHVQINGNEFKMYGFIADTSGLPIYKAELQGTLDELEGSGAELGQTLLDEGGQAILDKLLPKNG
ncbi:MAG: hydroxymethylbilane synthase [Lentisphaerales bacterium]|nr:hydroxymethylbilane synthase [Lentisphaerales bacterium]